MIPVLAVFASIKATMASDILSEVTASSASLAVVIAPSEILPSVIPADIVLPEMVIPLPAVSVACLASSCVCRLDDTPSRYPISVLVTPEDIIFPFELDIRAVLFLRPYPSVWL